jgi:hypothetical protein
MDGLLVCLQGRKRLEAMTKEEREKWREERNQRGLERKQERLEQKARMEQVRHRIIIASGDESR